MRVIQSRYVKPPGNWYIYAGRILREGTTAYVDRNGRARPYDGNDKSFYFVSQEEAELVLAKALLMEQPELEP